MASSHSLSLSLSHSLSLPSLSLPSLPPFTVLLLSALLLSIPLPAFSQLPAVVCPSFGCPSYGPAVCSEPQAGGFRDDSDTQLSTMYTNSDGSDVSKWQDCCQGCMEYPVGCAYWTHAILGDGTNVCHFFKIEVCDPGSEKTYIPCITDELTNDGQNFTSGSICLMAPKIEGDPHYTGADNSHFDFTGVPGKSYSILSDSHLQINVFHGGRFDRWGENPHKPLTWIRELAIFWGKHIIYLSARKGSEWKYGNGYMETVKVDNKPIVFQKVGDEFFFADRKISVKWIAAREKSRDDEIDIYGVKIENVLKLVLNLRPEIELLRTESDGVVHFGLELPEILVSREVHGVVGQTFRKDHNKRLALQKLQYDEHLKVEMVPGENAEGFLDGEVEDYETPSIFETNFKFSRFSGLEKAEVAIPSGVKKIKFNVNAGFLPRKMGINSVESHTEKI